MLRSILNLITPSDSEKAAAHAIDVAAAALMAEVMRADHDIEDSELHTIELQLKSQFSLSDEEVQAVVHQGQEESASAVDLVQFTQALNSGMTAERKEAVLQALWKVAYADNQLNPNEEYMIRKIADLLYIPHSRYIKTKLQASPIKTQQ